MRFPFARVATRDAARLSLRDRAAALKASASKVIRRKPVASVLVASVPALAVDPILAAIADTLINRAVACGDYEEAARLGVEANAKRL